MMLAASEIINDDNEGEKDNGCIELAARVTEKVFHSKRQLELVKETAKV